MLKIGQYNTLTITRFTDHGAYLDAGKELGDILLPKQYVKPEMRPGTEVEVIVYLDQQDRLVATTEQALACVGDFAHLRVAWVNEYGAFLDWGLMKDLFVPFREQKMKMQKGHRYVIHAHVDEDSYRIMASAKVERYLSKEMPSYQPGEEVEVMVWQRTDLGYKVIVDNKFGGLVYQKEIFKALEPGMKMSAYIRQVREDGKIDLTLQKDGLQKVGDFAEVLLQYIKDQGGHTSLNDKSAAEDIYDTFAVSKKTFKKAVGDLYKKRLIILVEDGIRLA